MAEKIAGKNNAFKFINFPVNYLTLLINLKLLKFN